MAVQAQYPSNILFLNRNGQDRKNMLGSDYSMQPQPVEFLDQSQIFFNGGGGNPRKRGREIAPTNLFSRQSNVVSTGLRLTFEEQQEQQNQSLVLPFLSEDIFSQIKQHSNEIDQLIQAQANQLRRTIAEKRQKQYHALLCAAEESASRRLKEKDSEIEKAIRRNTELEERLTQLRVEAQVWESQARAQETTVASLQAQLQIAMMNGGAQDKREEGFGCMEDAESGYIDPERVDSSELVCKACGKGAVSVVVLPCRHLCLCTDCGAVAEACPLCLSFRSACVQVYLS